LKLLRAAAMELPPAARFELWEGLAGLPPYTEDAEGASPPPSVAELRSSLAAADAVIVATPEYNASLPGQLKNALDWASRPFPDNALRGKPVAVIGASTGLFGAVWAQADARKVLNRIGAHVIDDEVPVGQADQAFDLDGRLRDPELRDALSNVVASLVREVRSPVELAA